MQETTVTLQPATEGIPLGDYKQRLPRGHHALVNGYNPPIPRKLLNQRQKRKKQRQING